MARGDVLRQPDHARDLRAALAADGEDPLAAAARAEQRESTEAAQLGDERAAAPDVGPRVGELLGHPAPVAQPHRALDLLIDAAEQIADDRRVARAAGVLQQQRIQQLGLLVGPQAERVGRAAVR